MREAVIKATNFDEDVDLMLMNARPHKKSGNTNIQKQTKKLSNKIFAQQHCSALP